MLAARLIGPGHEATFRQEFLEGIRQSLRADGLDAEIKLEEKGVAGRTDARIEHITFEIKSPGELAKKSVREHGLTQLLKYAEALGVKHRGLLTDGLQCALVGYHAGAGKFVYMDGMDTPLATGRELMQWSEVATPLSRMIASMALPHLDSESLLFHFGPSKPVARDALRAFWKQLNESKSEFTNLLFAQWRQLFALAVEFSVTETPGEDLAELFQMGGSSRSADAWDQAVFVVQTYYSLLLKLLALRIVDEIAFLQARFVGSIPVW